MLNNLADAEREVRAVRNRVDSLIDFFDEENPVYASALERVYDLLDRIVANLNYKDE